jgi:hypothetical protein
MAECRIEPLSGGSEWLPTPVGQRPPPVRGMRHRWHGASSRRRRSLRVATPDIRLPPGLQVPRPPSRGDLHREISEVGSTVEASERRTTR